MTKDELKALPQSAFERHKLQCWDKCQECGCHLAAPGHDWHHRNDGRVYAICPACYAKHVGPTQPGPDADGWQYGLFERDGMVLRWHGDGETCEYMWRGSPYWGQIDHGHYPKRCRERALRYRLCTRAEAEAAHGTPLPVDKPERFIGVDTGSEPDKSVSKVVEAPAPPAEPKPTPEPIKEDLCHCCRKPFGKDDNRWWDSERERWLCESCHRINTKHPDEKKATIHFSEDISVDGITTVMMDPDGNVIGVWNRALATAEMEYLQKNPSQILQPSIRKESKMNTIQKYSKKMVCPKCGNSGPTGDGKYNKEKNVIEGHCSCGCIIQMRPKDFVGGSSPRSQSKILPILAWPAVKIAKLVGWSIKNPTTALFWAAVGYVGVKAPGRLVSLAEFVWNFIG